jgi:hypothetical protein
MIRAIGNVAGLSPYMVSTVDTDKNGNIVRTHQTPKMLRVLPDYELTGPNWWLYHGAAGVGALNPLAQVAVNAAGLGPYGSENPLTIGGKTVIANPQAATKSLAGILFPSAIGGTDNPELDERNNVLAQYPEVMLPRTRGRGRR